MKAGVIIEKNGDAESKDMFLSNRGEFECGLDKAQGANIWDKEGKCYIDFNLGSGTFILGHGDSEVKNWQSKALEDGTLYVGGCTYLEELEKLIRENHKGLDDLVLATTGTESVIRAIRIARCVTKKEKIVVLEGCWHGSMDYTLYKKAENNIDVERLSVGLPDTYKGTEVMDTDFKSLEWLRSANNIAAVVMEPIRGSWPIEPNEEWKQELQSICREKNIILVLDEVISGHRYSRTGVYEIYNECAVLVCFGKAMGGGCPISMVGSNNNFAKQYGTILRTTVGHGDIVLGGTFTGNPLSTASAIGVQRRILDCSDLYEKLKETGEHLRKRFNEWCIYNKKEIGIVGTNSINKLVCRNNGILPNNLKERDEYWDGQGIKEMKDLMKSVGILVGGNNLMFTSYKHNKEMIDDAIERLERGLRNNERS